MKELHNICIHNISHVAEKEAQLLLQKTPPKHETSPPASEHTLSLVLFQFDEWLIFFLSSFVRLD